MIVTCPSCETKFAIPDDKYRPGRKARCSNCGFVFPLPELTEDISPPVDDLPLSPPPAQPAPAPPASPEDIVPPVSEKSAPPGRSRKKLPFILAIALAVALLGFGGVMVYSSFFAAPKTSDPARATDGKVVDSLGGRTVTEDEEKEAARQAAVRRLSLENVRQQTVTDNEKTGPMVVIEGTVVNNFDVPKDLILLEVTLYDGKGNALVLREQYCGVTLSLLQLRTLPKAAIESALSNQVVILTNNADIPPGGRVPFTTVFFDLPHSAYEFEVKIVDVQDSAPKK